eukprot:jgi/Ulvmu1/1884/UM012_0041.1
MCQVDGTGDSVALGGERRVHVPGVLAVFESHASGLIVLGLSVAARSVVSSLYVHRGFVAQSYHQRGLLLASPLTSGGGQPVCVMPPLRLWYLQGRYDSSRTHAVCKHMIAGYCRPAVL